MRPGATPSAAGGEDAAAGEAPAGGAHVDYRAVFAVLTAPKVVLSPDLVVLDANESFLTSVGRPAEAVLGRHFVDAFPVGPDGAEAVSVVVASLRRVVRTARLEMVGPHRYDVPERSGAWAERWWITTNVPVVDAGGRVAYLVHRAEDVTDVVVAGRLATGADAPPAVPPEHGVIEHAMAVSSTIGRFAAAFERERAAAIHLQASLLTPPPDVPGLTIAVRYRHAAPETNVGGDWYDAFAAPDGATVVVVGDVTGHDTAAAARMGQLRGTLRAVTYTHDAAPGAALDLTDATATGLGLGVTATAVVARVDAAAPDGSRRLTWSSAGHPPAVLVRGDGSARLLAGRPGMLLGYGTGAPRPQHTDVLHPGDVLLLYTDGLVERRGESLRATLAGLPDRVAALGAHAPDELLDAALAAFIPGGTDDDVALLAVRVDPAGEAPGTASAGSAAVPTDGAGKA
ncbi:SpoIIE family protein phosphatase [Cellulomonas shaoxiangyii]|uniref:Protein phosphatase n=1 Tax=Cellulomonas shaoxiangyii TaxID=2566013 RepID=A0A4P7SIK3_9CELL|nr:SpoIIE family protein phosphatase [Cellulomonas shaoxiangyii]QCB92283.1 protein phosphatase [Cellulomonas shaoxiangyii]TGY85905.1 protein phosphatase [Cellulomonas shaoxiangyii]